MDGHHPSIEAGTADRMGATYDGKGVNFALYSKNAARVELSLFSDDGKTELQRITLPKKNRRCLARLCAGAEARAGLWLPRRRAV